MSQPIESRLSGHRGRRLLGPFATIRPSGVVALPLLKRMRDKVIHVYFGVNLEIVWAVVEKELPKLAGAIRASLET
jgi:hypothetical protein